MSGKWMDRMREVKLETAEIQVIQRKWVDNLIIREMTVG